MSYPWYDYAKTLSALLKADYIVFKSNLLHKLIDITIVIVANLVIMGYIMPHLGLQPNFGVFMLASMVANAGLFEVYPLVSSLVSDIAGPKKISYELTLPIPTWLVFIKIIISVALQGIVIGLITLPLGKLILQDQLVLSHISVSGMLAMLILNGIFSATFGLWIASMIKNMSRMSSVWTRFIFPLWIFGGFQFSWASLHAAFPILSYVNLINPILYTTEGFRTAILGGKDYLPLKICLPALLISITIFAVWGITRLKKKLDFI